MVSISEVIVESQGVPWTEEQAVIIASKLRHLWTYPRGNFNHFDKLNNPNATSSGYLYDPTKRLSENTGCDTSQGMCKRWTGKGRRRTNDLDFSEAKALRLAFHDCVPYEDGSGGCDGCLNLDENKDDNIGLEFTVAILERLYTDVDFPTLRYQKNLEKSPKDLGISRADLWAFAGLLAMDEHLQFTKSFCEHNSMLMNCGDNSTTCYTPMHKYWKLFQTGRKDCIAADHASELQQYVASKVEAHPSHGGNGEMTVKYFREKFNMAPYKALALMGAHTIGKFNPINSRLDYSWVRSHYSHRNDFFNNEYYKILALRPAKVKGECTGDMHDQPAESVYEVFANAMTGIWPAPNPWANGTNHPGKMTWRVAYIRAPTCHERYDMHEDSAAFFDTGFPNDLAKSHGFETGFEWCCAEKEAGCAGNNSCPAACDHKAQNRIR